MAMDPLCDQPSIVLVKVLVIIPLTAIRKDDVIAGDLIFHALIAFQFHE